MGHYHPTSDKRRYVNFPVVGSLGSAVASAPLVAPGSASIEAIVDRQEAPCTGHEEHSGGRKQAGGEQYE